MISLVLFFAVALVWFVSLNRNLYAALPLYLIANAIPAPWATEIVVYPDKGLGGVVEVVPTVGDLLLVMTVVALPAARRELGRDWRLLALAALSLIVSLAAVMRNEIPPASSIYLGCALMRLAFGVALFRAAASKSGAVAAWSRAATVTVGMFGVLAVLYLMRDVPVLGTIANHLKLVGGDGRLNFPTLGNNKIGLALLLTLGATVVQAPKDDLRLRFFLCAGLFTAIVADLRFATAGFLLVGGAYMLVRSSRVALAAFVMAFSIPLVLALRAVEGVPRALTTLSSSFNLAGDSSLNSRIELWAAAIDVWSSSVLIGDLGRWEYARPVTNAALLAPLEPHSEVLWLGASFGALGALLWASVMVDALRAAWFGGFLPSAMAVIAATALLLNSATFFPAAALCLSLYLANSWGALRRRPGEGANSFRPDIGQQQARTGAEER